MVDSHPVLTGLQLVAAVGRRGGLSVDTAVW